jgi:hypothetical protein
MKESEYFLTLTIEENEHFKPGFEKVAKKTVTVADILTKPASWDALTNILFSAYTPAKHRFMVDAAARLGIVFDNEFFTSNISYNGGQMDIGLMNYWKTFFQNKLAEENQRRADLGLGPLREDPNPGQTEGAPITI